MAKQTVPYFSHDHNARNSPKIANVRMKYGAEGYGIFFMILERLRESDNYMSVTDYNAIAFDLRVDAAKVKSIVEDFGLFAFTDNGECFYSESFNRRMDIKDEQTKKRSEAGKKGAATRWGNPDGKNDTALEDDGIAINKNSNAMAMPQNKMASKDKISKDKISKDKISKDDDDSARCAEGHQLCVDKLNATLGSSSSTSEWLLNFDPPDQPKVVEEVERSSYLKKNINRDKPPNGFFKKKLLSGYYRDYQDPDKNAFDRPKPTSTGFSNFTGRTNQDFDLFDDIGKMIREGDGAP